MSHSTYNELWSEAQDIVESATRDDSGQQSARPTKDREVARTAVANLYLSYIRAVNRLNQCHDQMVQPQKRRLVRRLLDASVGRMLELKNDLVNIDSSEFSYFDNVMMETRVCPEEAEVEIPTYYRRERELQIKEKRDKIDSILRALGYYEGEEEEVPMEEEEAVKLLQTHERARQGRLRAQFMKEIKVVKDRAVKPLDSKDEKSLEESSREAALKIQQVWRGYITRRRMRKRVVEEMILIGMLPPETVSHAERMKAVEVMAARRIIQEQYELDYTAAIEKHKYFLRDRYSETMMEEMTDQIRAWYNSYRASTGKLPDLPPEEAGGSAVIFSKHVGPDSERSKSTGQSSKESKQTAKGKKDKGKKGKDKDDGKKKKLEEDEEELGFKMSPSNFLSELLAASGEFRETWMGKDESSNPQQTHYMDVIDQQQRHQLESELRKIVDEQMRKELEALQAALDRDRARKGKRAKKAVKKKGKRGGKKGKKKKEKDLTPDRTTESLFEELVTNGIIKKYPEVPISAFLGERSFINYELRSSNKDPQPALGDIRQVIKEYCILPLGSKVIRSGSPLIKSVLLVGPKGSGKRLLVNAVCTELGATVFDLTPANIVGKYPGKLGLIMLIHLVNKVSRLLQPSVIFIDSAEKTFLKKVPKTDKTDPKRLKKDLPKLVKGIGPDDQVMLIGTSRCPWDCDQKLLAQTYTKMIMIPKPEYSSRSLLFSQKLFQYSSLSRQFNISSLVRISDGYTIGSILSALSDVLTCKRVLQLRVQQLTHGEIINMLAKYEPVYKEEEEAFYQWYLRTPMGRKRAKIYEQPEDEDEPDSPDKEKED